METILKLFRGQLSEEALSDPTLREKLKKPLDEKIVKEADKFYEELSKEQRGALLSYWQVESEEWSAEVDEAFIIGFKTGARLMMDILERE